MKKEFSTCPSTINQTDLYGFAWEDYVTAIPTPLLLVTTYKENGKTNATMQSWSTFISENGFYCIFGSVNKGQHMYRTIHQTGHLVINFPSVDNFQKCMDTIRNNAPEDDEIGKSGLTYENASKVNAPRVKECFLNLECEYVWEKEISSDSNNIVMCVKVVNVCMDEEYYNEKKKGRYGETGYLYNIHSPRNPENGEKEETYVGIITKYATFDEVN